MLVTAIALKYTLYWYANDRYIFFVNELIQFYVNNSMNIRLLTPHIMPSYTHNMAIVS